MSAALAAFYRRVPVGHVEAGLRTYNRYEPFPEEANRRLISALATYHLAPTETARDALLAENVDPASIFVTGNTVIDALQWTVRQPHVLHLEIGRASCRETGEVQGEVVSWMAETTRI